MRVITVLMLLCLTLTAVAQTKKPATTLDVDRLYAKYKDYETVSINTPDGSISANVKVLLNDNGKPHAVILYGTVPFSSGPDINSIKRTLESAKEKAGYTRKGLSSTIFFEDKIVSAASLYQKGTQYAKYAVTEEYIYPEKLVKESKELGLSKEYAKVQTGSFFYFEVGDVKRRSTQKQEDFTF